MDKGRWGTRNLGEISREKKESLVNHSVWKTAFGFFKGRQSLGSDLYQFLRRGVRLKSESRSNNRIPEQNCRKWNRGMTETFYFRAESFFLQKKHPLDQMTQNSWHLAPRELRQQTLSRVTNGFWPTPSPTIG
ncbi:hypothetical protein CDAR_409771 [Caerostris darwini]|uniref:Uncharacterized protein n=1 Tax=Caerostris darwini TaxID=1538125 RepID=A0AAV4RLA7_9ARAC|nr:hypothetical protein CDAR_409771 [Caerostris darwini]